MRGEKRERFCIADHYCQNTNSEQLAALHTLNNRNIMIE